MRRRSPLRESVPAVVAAVLVSLGLGACSSPNAANGRSTTVTGPETVRADVAGAGIPAFYTPPRPLPAGPPGSLIRTEKVTGVPGVPPDATVWRILFHSRAIYNTDMAESGYIVVPGGDAPPAGYPILSWAHGTTGFAGICAPSLFTSQGGVGPYLIPGLTSYLRAGFVVAATDYEGLGTPGVHPYLLGESEGRGVLDAARAARHLEGVRTSGTVIIYGHSQGGQAALFAGQLAPGYAPDLHVAGVVAAAPATGLSTIMGVLTTSVGQGILEFTMPVAYTWARTYLDLPLSDMFTSSGGQVASSIVTRGCLPALLSAISSRHLSATSVFLPGAATNPVVVAHARLNDPGRVKTSAPMLVVQGTADTTVPPALTDQYLTTMACPIGDTVDYLHVTGATHGTVVNVSVPTITQWMTARLDDKAPPSTCGRPGDVETLTP
jgi:pimeloyl-ACP methyl ester carboxylesterase